MKTKFTIKLFTIINPSASVMATLLGKGLKICFQNSTTCAAHCRFLSSVPLKERQILLKSGLNIHYVETGSGDHPVLLLPGALGTAKTDFSPQLEGLNKSGQLKVIAWDPPGYGKSRPPDRTWSGSPNFFFGDADAAVELMTSLGHNRFSLVGWSDGAITSLVVAGRHPKLITKMVSLAGNSYASSKDFEMLAQVVDVSKWSKKMRESMENIYGEDYFPILWSQWYEAYNSLKSANGDICNALLPNIECPTLIIQGDQDGLVSMEHPPFLEKNIKNARVKIFQGGKHNLHFKHCDEFNKVVEEFLLE